MRASCTAAALLALLAAACGDRVKTGLTGIDVRVTFDADLPVYKLRFSGWVGSAVAFAQEDRPDENRPPSPGGEDLVILLPDSMAGQQVFLQVDGIDRGGAPLGSAGRSVAVERRKIVPVEVRLGAPRICGDAEVHPSAELCDDGNIRSGDGCSSQCLLEDGWVCASGAPTVCRRCGDGVCAQGEDQCTCPVDCAGATCGDGLCCAEAGETCSCAADCGPPPCGDGLCCEGEEESSCPDCGDCGNGSCEIDKGEDQCRCPEDCESRNGECGNGSCCAASGEDAGNCPADCCQDPTCGDGACCPTENAADCPRDCCAAPTCGDGVCCPTEDAAECPGDCCASAPICGDGVCCPDQEDADSCAGDCCSQSPPCGDGRCCPGESCEADGCEPCPSCSSGGSCDPCCEKCAQDAACDYVCQAGCDCNYDCRDGSFCQIECRNSSCFVECDLDDCIVDCKVDVVSDAGVALPGDCACRGAGCALTCPGGATPVSCPDGVSVACSLLSCP